MVKFSILAIFGLVASTVHAIPILERRIAQVIVQSTVKWEQACLAAGGSTKCNPVSVASFSTLLAGAGPCDQQDAADNQIDLAKQLNSPEMITLSQIFVQQPRNSPNSVSIPYCQKAPRHQELTGLFQCQFQGVDKQVFVGGLQVGAQGTIPFGRTTAVQPPGSCPANPGGPVPDSQQLVDITQTPNAPVPASSGGDSSSNSNPAPAPASPSPSPSPTDSTPPDSTPTPAPPTTSPPTGNAADGIAAQQQNAKFATLTPQSSCTVGEIACVQGAFAQCVGGHFVMTPCASGTMCAALPGSVVTCTTQADAISRIQATGATGGLTG